MATAAKLAPLPETSRPGDRLLKPEEVAEITSLSIETLAQWRSQRKGIAFVKLSNNCVRYRRADLDAYISARIVRVEPSEGMRR